MPTSSCGIPSEASWISQRGACVMSSAMPNGITQEQAHEERAAEPARRVSGDADGPGARTAPAAASAVTPEAISSIPPAIMPTPVTSRQSGPELTTCRPCETTPKPNASAPATSASSKRVGRVRRGWRATHRPGQDDRRTPATVVAGPENGEVEQVQRDEREPARQERALPAGEPPPPPAPPRARRGG